MHTNVHNTICTRAPSITRVRTRSDGSVLQDDTVVDEADVFAGLGGLGALLAEQVEDARRQDGVLAVLDELAQVRQPDLLRLGVVLQDADDCVHNAFLVVKATLQQTTHKKCIANHKHIL